MKCFKALLIVFTASLIFGFVLFSSSMALASGSCEGYCGGKAYGGCWCDNLCEQLGDCCDDYNSVCVPGDNNTLSCVGNCGGAAPGGCYCDSLCTKYGDCCLDYAAHCIGDLPITDPSVPGPATYTINSFVLEHSNSVKLGNLYYHWIEIKCPSLLYYAKIRLILNNSAIIKRMIPLQIEPTTDTKVNLAIQWLRWGGGVVSEKVAHINTIITGTELLLKTLSLINDKNVGVLSEVDISNWPASSVFFFVETDIPTSFEKGVTWQSVPNTTMASDFSLFYPHIKAPF